MSCPVHNIHNGELANGTVKAGGERKVAPGQYIKWDAPGVEVEQPGEQEKIRQALLFSNRGRVGRASGIQQVTHVLMDADFNEHMHCLRGTHLKTQGCVVGKFIVRDDLPSHLAQGMFAKPGTYDCIMRYSSLTPKIVPDNVPAPRGIGIKVFGVEGEKLWGEDKSTQDWTLNNYPILELRDPKTTYDIADSLERNWNDLATFADEQSKRVDADVATMGSQLPRQHMVAMPQWSQSAYRHGDNVAKYGVFPLGKEQLEIQKDHVKEDDPINILSQHTRDFHMRHKVSYKFCAQMLQNLDEQPVDDIGIEWDEKKYPMEHVATLEFDPQDSWSSSFRSWWDDRITCNSWHGLKTHQPLGSTNRMRRVVYAESRKLRLRANGYQDYIEPSSVKEVPAPIADPQLSLPFQPAVNTTEIAAAS